MDAGVDTTRSEEATRPGGHRERVEVLNDQMGSDMLSSSTECGRPATEIATGTPKLTPANPGRHRHTRMVGFPRPAWATVSGYFDSADATIEHATSAVVRDTFLGSDDVVHVSLSVLDAMDVAEDGTVLVERSEPTVRFDEGDLSLAASARMARSLVKLVASAIGGSNPWAMAGAESVIEALDTFVTVVEDETGRAATEERAQ